jgi:hypothetical protein
VAADKRGTLAADGRGGMLARRWPRRHRAQRLDLLAGPAVTLMPAAHERP